jgi:SAM-dependent methyltransferase
VDLPRAFTIRESSHRIHNPLTSAKLATLGAALRLAPGARILDLACGSGELLCTWARDHDAPVDVAACVGATWIGGGVAGTVELLCQSLRPGGLMLVGEPVRHARYQREYLGWGVFALMDR